jgi:hypothetical protein
MISGTCKLINQWMKKATQQSGNARRSLTQESCAKAADHPATSTLSYEGGCLITLTTRTSSAAEH